MQTDTCTTAPSPGCNSKRRCTHMHNAVLHKCIRTRSYAHFPHAHAHTRTYTHASAQRRPYSPTHYTHAKPPLCMPMRTHARGSPGHRSLQHVPHTTLRTSTCTQSHMHGLMQAHTLQIHSHICSQAGWSLPGPHRVAVQRCRLCAIPIVATTAMNYRHCQPV